MNFPEHGVHKKDVDNGWNEDIRTFEITDAKISSKILKKLLKKHIETTFNAISCDGDTSTNDMVSIFATGAAKNSIINRTIKSL